MALMDFQSHYGAQATAELQQNGGSSLVTAWGTAQGLELLVDITNCGLHSTEKQRAGTNFHVTPILTTGSPRMSIGACIQPLIQTGMTA